MLYIHSPTLTFGMLGVSPFGFILGGMSGALLYAEFLFIALLIPAIVCLIMAVTYRVYSHGHS